MARRSLKPQLNQIRAWVQEGRTDAWIAHQLEISVRDLKAFKREHELAPPEDGGAEGGAADELDLREQDDALVAAELDAEPEPAEDEPDEDDDEADEDKPQRRRGRRGGRGRRSGSRTRPSALEGTFDHGEEGFGLWLDPAVQDDAVYAEHWRGHRSVTVTLEADRIVIRRSGESDDGTGDDED